MAIERLIKNTGEGENMYRNWLAEIKPLSNRKKLRLSEEFPEIKELYNMKEKDLKLIPYLMEKDVTVILNAQKRSEESLQETLEKYHEKGIKMISVQDKEYPERLKHIEDAPYILYVKGRLPEETAMSVAIVGARRCTAYGEEMALLYGEKLGAAGVQVISGMAKGIDGAGQRGALNSKALTYGVLGCGVDICYPREYIGLYMDIQEKGGIISEQIPGSPPLPAYFPMRNRIISGLSDVILVIEAKERSGSLITADLALEQGKDVYALPGPVTSTASRGCHQLIRQGAGILLSPEELLEELDIEAKGYGQNSVKNEKVLESTENMLYSCVGLFPKSMSQLMEETGLDARKTLEVLTSLQLQGIIKEVSKNYYIRTR